VPNDLNKTLAEIAQLLKELPIAIEKKSIPPGMTHVTINFNFGNQTQNNADTIQIGAQGEKARSENSTFKQNERQFDLADLVERLEGIISERRSSKNEDD